MCCHFVGYGVDWFQILWILFEFYCCTLFQIYVSFGLHKLHCKQETSDNHTLSNCSEIKELHQTSTTVYTSCLTNFLFACHGMQRQMYRNQQCEVHSIIITFSLCQINIQYVPYAFRARKIIFHILKEKKERKVSSKISGLLIL